MKALVGLFFFMAIPAGTFAAECSRPLQNAPANRLEVPIINGPVMDLADVLAPAEIEHLKDKIQRLKADNTTEMAVLIVANLQGESLEEYSLRVANTWKLGRCGINNGVLILVAMKDRALRIEVGLGLESILTNAACKKIIDQNIIPFFKANDFYGGLDSGVNSIIKILASSREYRDILSSAHNCSDDVRSLHRK